MTASLLSLSDELIVHVAQITSDFLYSDKGHETSPTPCSCGHCPTIQPKPNASATPPPHSDLHALSWTCKKLQILLRALLYQEITLENRKSVDLFARTLIDHPGRGWEVRALTIQGEGNCGTISAFFSEWLTLFVLGKCSNLERVTFVDVRDGQDISHMCCWPVAIQVLSGVKTLTSITFDRCAGIDFRGSLPLPDLTHLTLRNFTPIRHLKKSHLPSLKWLHLDKLDDLILPEDLPIPSLQHTPNVTLSGKVHPLTILRVLECFDKLESLRISVDDTKVELNLPPNLFQDLPRFMPPPHLKLFNINLKLDDHLMTLIPMLNVFEEIVSRSGSPKVVLDLELNKRTLVGVELLEAGIVHGARKVLRSAGQLEINLNWMRAKTRFFDRIEVDIVGEQEEEWQMVEEGRLFRE